MEYLTHALSQNITSLAFIFSGLLLACQVLVNNALKPTGLKSSYDRKHDAL